MSAPPVFLSGDQWRQKIVVELGSEAILEQSVRLLWDAHDAFRGVPYTQYLKTKLAAIDLLLGNLDQTEHFPVTEEGANRLTNRRIILLALRRIAETDLAKTGSGLIAYGPSMGLLTTTAPVMSPPGAPDANGYQILGDPNQPAIQVVRP